MEQGSFKKGIVLRRNALPHVAEDHRLNTREQTGVAEMKKHAVPLVWLRGHVFQKENTALSVRSIRRAE